MRYVRTLAVLMFLAWTPPLLASDSRGVAGLEPLSWMLGDWAFTRDGVTTGERWRRTDDLAWEGYGFMVKEGDTSRTEDLRLLVLQGEVFYISKVGHNPLPVAFKLISGSDSACVFENPSHDFPQRIRYRRTEAGITARIEGESSGKPRSAEFPFVAIPAASSLRKAPD